MKIRIRQRQGSLLVDVLLAIAVASLFAVALAGLASMSNRSVTAARHQTEAAALAKGAMEQVVAIKQAKWSDLELGRVVISRQGNKYEMDKITDQAAPDELLGGVYTRRIELSEVYRDAAGKFSTVGTPDPHVMQITVTVRWTEREEEHQVVLVNYVTNWKRL
jgi:Tfp pilus assembly protein PilV